MLCKDGTLKSWSNKKVRCDLGNVFIWLLCSDNFFRPFNKYQSRVCYTENYKILSLEIMLTTTTEIDYSEIFRKTTPAKIYLFNIVVVCIFRYFHLYLQKPIKK